MTRTPRASARPKQQARVGWEELERQRFERWICNCSSLSLARDDDNTYMFLKVDWAWEAWLARARLTKRVRLK